MAIYLRKFCALWIVNLFLILAIESTMSIKGGSLYKYHVLDSFSSLEPEGSYNLIDFEHHRSPRQVQIPVSKKRNLEILSGPAASRTFISQPKSGNNNSSTDNFRLSNSASSNGTILSPSSDASKLRSKISPNVETGSVSPMDSPLLTDSNRLLSSKQHQEIPHLTLGSPATSNNSSNDSISSDVSKPGTVISAGFAKDAKPQSHFIPQISPDLNSESVKDDDGESDIAINQYPEEITNKTLKEENITSKVKDTHIYYNSTFIVDEKTCQQYWDELSNKDDVKIHEMLSKSHRRAATVQLSFEFPFYGHFVTNVTIATGGFIFTGDHIHSWLAATQYIAPLMANFDNSISKNSYVKYYDNGTAFVVLWENVFLKDSPEFGNFTFETVLHKNGDIIFIYKHIPVSIETIRDDEHPVKVGLSDAYIIDRTIFFVKRKTIYEYHRVNFSKEDIKNWTVIYLNALPTCHDFKDCESCTNSAVNLECKWCPAVERCSTGLDRFRQEWLSHECDKSHVSSCNEPAPPPPFAHKAAESSLINSKNIDTISHKSSRSTLSASGVISLMLMMTSFAALAFIALYAYRNPHSAPGQILIRYRPSQWRWRRGEARYTAATIHM